MHTHIHVHTSFNSQSVCTDAKLRSTDSGCMQMERFQIMKHTCTCIHIRTHIHVQIAETHISTCMHIHTCIHTYMHTCTDIIQRPKRVHGCETGKLGFGLYVDGTVFDEHT